MINAEQIRAAVRAVEGVVEVWGGDGNGEREGGDLGKGVNAGVGATGALGEDGFAGDVVDGMGEGALHGGEVGLDLPAVVGGSVVGEDDLPVRHEDALDGITAGRIRSGLIRPMDSAVAIL